MLASQEDEYSLSDIVHYTESFLLWFGDSFTPILSVSFTDGYTYPVPARCRSKSAFSGGDCFDAVLYYVEYGSETIGSGLCHQLYLCSSPYYFADLCHCDRRNHHNSCFIGIGTDSERSIYCRKGSELEEINSVGNCFNFLSLRFSMKSSLWLHSTLFQEELH